MNFETILVEPRNTIGVITLNRPDALNALNRQMCEELITSLTEFDQNSKIDCVVLTGSDKAFAAGADIKEMLDLDFVTLFGTDQFAHLALINKFRKPLIAAVSGYALGGGCELAMMCDIIIAADSAKFGQPEITLGVMPGWGGSQRLTRAVGKSKAMDMILTGRTMDAEEAERSGLVSRVVPQRTLLEEAMKVAQTITDNSLPATQMAKEAINRAFEVSLAEGLRSERRMFYSLFSTEDQKEGMSAFTEKRSAHFKNR